MSTIFVSSVPFGPGEDVARKLAQKLGYFFLSRNDVLKRAGEFGIPVGKLEMAAFDNPPILEHMGEVRGKYLTFARAFIGERAAEGSLVYYGLAGQHKLPGVPDAMRVRVIPDHGQRVATVMEKINLSREEAERFLRSMDDEIKTWVRFMYNIDLDDATRYDIVMNLERLSIENAVSGLCGIVVPAFKAGPAARSWARAQVH
jgi:cytidylate kinase